MKTFSKFIKYFTCLNIGELPCLEGYFQCYNITNLCIYKLNANEVLIPCENGRHLQQCKNFLCDIMFKCLENYCISWSYVCDGKWDCPHWDDELENIVCNKKNKCLHMYHCRNTKQICIHLGNTCDGYDGCLFGDDESLCELKSFDCPSFCMCVLYAIDCRLISGPCAPLLCEYKWSCIVQTLLHSSHLYMVLVWTLAWHFKLFFCAKRLSHWVHG